MTDTHSLIWYFDASPRLGQVAHTTFEQVVRGEARLIVPSIVIAELLYAQEKKRILLNIDAVLARLDENQGIEITPLSKEIVLEMRKLTAPSEMHDRLIVCEAKLRGAKLITRDAEIQNAKVVETVW